jgi:2-alkyl-3-oxoalkanoate reductase
VDDAAKATWMAIESETSGVFQIVDDEPAAVSVWLPELAGMLGAPPPRHVPEWLGKLAMGEPGLFLMTQARGCSNAKAQRALGWRPEYGSWRAGFRAAIESD